MRVLHTLGSVTEQTFIDHYEILQVSQTADTETIERVFRLLAKRYHPDNAVTGDPRQFDEVRQAYDLLSNPERRAQYDITYDDEKGCIALGFLDSGLTVFAPTLPRPARRGRVAPGPGFDSDTSPASTARCTSA